MNGLPYYKAYPRDFVEGTIGMPFELKCAYRVVLDLIYMQGGRLPDDARYIAGLLGCTVRKWNKLRAGLISLGKISISDGTISNHRADIELDALRKLQEKQRENATNPRKNRYLAEPWQSHTEPEPEPEKRKEKRACAPPRYSDEFEAFWKAYPDKTNNSKPKASESFEALSYADKQQATASLRAYEAFLAKPNAPPCAHATTYLNQRRFETFEIKQGGPDIAGEVALFAGDQDDRRRRRRWDRIVGGPCPDEPGCRAPLAILAEHGFWSGSNDEPSGLRIVNGGRAA